METVRDFIWGGSEITADDNCSHEIKTVAPWKKSSNLDSILKSRDITLPTKVRLVKAMVFPVVRYGSELDYKESWAPKNWCFWTVVLEKTPESHLDCKEIKQKESILKEINPEYSLEGLMLKLKLQYFGHLMQRANSLEKDPDAVRLRSGGEGGDKGWDGWMASTQWTRVLTNSGREWRTEKLGMLQSVGSQRVGHDWTTEQQQYIFRIVLFSFYINS